MGDELRPSANDYIGTKRRYSSFDGTSLDSSLGETYDGKGADTIIMTGVHTHICIKHMAFELKTTPRRDSVENKKKIKTNGELQKDSYRDSHDRTR